MSKTYSNDHSVFSVAIPQSGGGGKRKKSLGVVPGDCAPRYLRPKQAAKYVSVGNSTFYRWIEQKLIKVSSIAGVRLIRTSDLDALVEANLR